MPLLARLSLLLAAAAPAMAAMRQRDATVRWFWEPGCSGEPHTTVVAIQGFCQRVPNAVAFPGYRVTCNSDGSGLGTIQYCEDVNCGRCTLSLPIAANQCAANVREVWGNAGVTVECPARGTGDIIVPESQFLAPQNAEINWFEGPGCGANIPMNFDRSIVVARQGSCNLVPNAPGNEGYKISCEPDGSGTLSFCTDRSCSTCPINTPFQSEVCLPNPPQYGAQSLAVRCPGTPPPPVQPFSPAA